MKFQFKVLVTLLFTFVILKHQVIFSQPRFAEKNGLFVKVQDSETSLFPSKESKSRINNNGKELSFRKILLSLKHIEQTNSRTPNSRLFKYDTSWNNPEHRCYEIRKSLSKKHDFLFNFMSQDKYIMGRGQK